MKKKRKAGARREIVTRTKKAFSANTKPSLKVGAGIRRKEHLPVVGIGASAGGLRARGEKRPKRTAKPRALPRTNDELCKLLQELQCSRTELERVIEQYASLYDFAPVGYFSLEHDSKVRNVNLTGARMLGAERSNIIKHRFIRFVSEDSHPAFNELLRGVFERKTKSSGQLLLLKQGSEPFYAHIEATPGMHEHECRLVVVDITERKRAEEELRKSEEKYRGIFDNVQDVYYEASIDGTLLEVSPSIGIMSKGQYSRDGLIGKSMNDFYVVADRRQALLALLHERGSVADYEVMLKNRDGSQVACSISAKIQFDAHGAPLKIIGSMRDITERKRAKEQIEILSRFPTENPNPVLRIAPEGVILYANDASEPLLATWNIQMGQVVPDDWRMQIAEVSKSGQRKEIEVRCGQQVFNCILASVVGTGYVNVYGHDITERKRAEEELKRRTEDLSLLTALNAAANRGESLQKIISLLAEQTNRIFFSTGASLYLPSEDKQYLIMHSLLIPPAQVDWIEKLIGARIPKVRIALNEGSLYRRIWHKGKPNLTNDPKTIQSMIAEFTENRTLKKFVPAIFTFLGIRSVITAPIIAGDELLGMMDISRNEPFTETDVERIGIIAEELSAILQRKRVEEGIRRAQEELSRLNAHLNKIREEERTRVAREIHDDLGQALTTVKIDLSLLESKLKPDQTDLIRRCKAMQALMNDTIATVHRISNQLRPGLLDDLGLDAAIEWQTQDFQSRTGIVCTIKVLSDLHTLGAEASVEIFRIFQEALTNVARHSKATTLDIVMAETIGCLVLEIKDNGVGIDSSRIDRSTSLGLIGMRERAKSIGGSVLISGAPGSGTCVKVEVPIAQESPVNTTNMSRSDDR